MENLYSVRIIRKENQAVKGEYIKQFLMFCGVYVREFILEYAEELKDDQEVDCNIFLTEEGIHEQNLRERLAAGKEICIGDIDGECDLSTIDKRKKFGKKLEDLLLGRLAEKGDDIYVVYQVFVKYDMAYVNYISHLYLYQFDLYNDESTTKNNLKEKYIQKYKKCLRELYKSGEEFTGSVYKKFAYLNCGRKINRISRANKQLDYFYVAAIVKAAHQLNEEDKRFSMGNVLAGLAGLTEYETERDAESYLNNAMKQEAGQKHSAFLYYCLGHYYELERHDWVMGWEQYKKIASIADPCNYRFNFKCGCKEFRDGNYENAWKIFTTIYNAMKIRAQREWIQPLEIEYYYKCARILSEIPDNMDNFNIFVNEIERPTEYQVYDILENCMKKSKFVEGFIGKRNMNQIQEFYKNKMEGHSINNILGR